MTQNFYTQNFVPYKNRNVMDSIASSRLQNDSFFVTLEGGTTDRSIDEIFQICGTYGTRFL